MTSFMDIKHGDVAVEVVPPRNKQHASGVQKLVDRWDNMLERTWMIC